MSRAALPLLECELKRLCHNPSAKSAMRVAYSGSRSLAHQAASRHQVRRSDTAVAISSAESATHYAAACRRARLFGELACAERFDLGLDDRGRAAIERGEVLVAGERRDAHLILDEAHPPLYNVEVDQLLYR